MNPNISELTLRDLFAGLAMHAAYSNPENHWDLAGDTLNIASMYAYRAADAMLKAREGK
jgi:hypothetical protein